MLAAQLVLINPFGEQLTVPSPEGPCPDSREFVAANISLLASRFGDFGRVLTADRLLNVGGTLGAIRRTAIDKYTIERAVRDLRSLLTAKVTMDESTQTMGKNSRTRLRGARPIRIYLYLFIARYENRKVESSIARYRFIAAESLSLQMESSA